MLQEVAQRLRKTGASVKLKKGSRGAEDGWAKWPSGKFWIWQAKSTRKGRPSQPSVKDTGRLKQKATKHGATPVIAEVLGNGKIKFKSARTERELKP